MEGDLLSELKLRWRYMEITDVIEEMNFSFWKEERCGDRVNRSITPALILDWTKI